MLGAQETVPDVLKIFPKVKPFIAFRVDGPAAVFSHIFKHEPGYAGLKMT